MTEPNTTGGVQQQQIQVQVRDEKAHNIYANWVNVRPTHQVEEVFLDLGVMSMGGQQGQANLDIQARVALSFFNAKRLALQLSQVVQRYEQQFGVVELDPSRRLRQG